MTYSFSSYIDDIVYVTILYNKQISNQTIKRSTFDEYKMIKWQM